MADWLVRKNTLFGFSFGQQWMLIALALIALGVFMTWKLDRAS
jgi:hypothetical protein